MIFKLFIHSFIDYSRNEMGEIFHLEQWKEQLLVDNNESFQAERDNYAKNSFTPTINPFTHRY